MIVTLSVICGLIFLSAILNSSLDQVKNKVDVNVYFVTNANEDDILSLKKSVEALLEVEKVAYISRDQALNDFKERHKNDEFTLQALDELSDNPLGAVLNIKAKDPSQYEGIANFLQKGNFISSAGAPIIDKVNYFQNKVAIDTLSNIINTADRLGFIFTIIFIAVSVLITFNTIRLVIYISREEIAVMRLVGASAFYIRGPFVVGGAVYGFISGIITLVIFYPITFWFSRVATELYLGLNIFSYYTSNFGQIFLIVISSGVGIGALSSYLAVRKYLAV